MYAAAGGHTHAVEALASTGANLNIQDKVSCSSHPTAVVCIATWHYQRCSGGFLSSITVHTCTLLPPQDGDTALMWATLWGRSETLHVLVQHSADLNVQNMVCM